MQQRQAPAEPRGGEGERIHAFHHNRLSCPTRSRTDEMRVKAIRTRFRSTNPFRQLPVPASEVSAGGLAGASSVDGICGAMAFFSFAYWS
jgi:hypothetical protein